MQQELNKYQKCKSFEKESFEFLKTKFDQVNWLSKHKKTPFDYECFKDGKKYNVDAKTQFHLEKSQGDINFVVMKIKGKLELLNKNKIEEIIKEKMDRARFDNGLLRLNILKMLRENLSGLTISKIAEILKETRYKINKEVYNLAGLGELTIEKVGNYEVVRIK